MLRSCLGYLAFATLALIGPGLALQRLLCRGWDAALVVPTGLAACAAAYWMSLVAGWPALFPLLVVLLDLTLAWPGGGSWRPREGPSLRGAVAPGLAVVALLALTQYRGNRLAADGSFLLDPFVAADTAFHVGLTRELTLGHPPQVPGVAGFPLAYHLGTDLVRAAALRWTRVDPYDQISRLDVTLLALALLLAVRSAARALGGPPLAVALAGWSLLATDFSFVFAADHEAHWWADLLRGNLLVSLALANPVIPGLALVLGALLALDRHERGQGRGWLALALLLAAAVPFFKVFLGAHLLLGLGAAFLVGGPRRAALAALALPCAAATALLALGAGPATVAVGLAPLDLVQATRETLGLAPASGLPLLAWAALWLVASVGLRLVGVAEAARALSASASLPCALAAMALAAWPLGLAFRVGAPELLAREKAVNDAAYLVEQGGVLLWLFAARAVAGLVRSAQARRLAVATAALLALPSTAHFVVKKARLDLDRVPAAAVRAVRVAEAHSAPGEVILQRPGARYPPLPVILASRRVAYERFTPYLSQFAHPGDLERRHQAVHRFFQTEDAGEALALARGLGAQVLILYGAERVRFDTAGALEPLHAEPGARVYRLMAR
jgi:hypothetical protein